jgi:hypothetical protein
VLLKHISQGEIEMNDVEGSDTTNLKKEIKRPMYFYAKEHVIQEHETMGT